MATIAETLALAFQYQQAQQWYQAEQLYRQVLEADPGHAEAWRRLGSVYQAVGNRAAAVASFQKALELFPGYAEAHNDLGILLATGGELDQAVAHFREASRLAPQFADPCNNLGVVLGMQGKHAEAEVAFQQAVHLRPANAAAHNNLGNTYLERHLAEAAAASYRQALQINPNYAEAHRGLGMALMRQGRLHEAVMSFQQALRLRPNYAEAHNDFGLALTELGHLEDAVANYQQAARLRPNSAAVLTNLGTALRKQGKLADAVASYQEALRCQPNYTDAYNSLGNTLLQMGKCDEAIAHYRQALALRPDHAEVHNNLGTAYVEQGKRAEAVTCLQQAVRLKPDYAEAHRNLALLWLLLGNFEQGWPEFEWRWQCRDFPKRSFAQPRWDGSPLQGRTVLLHAEQGFGDTLQFIRYAPRVKERGGAVVVECQPELVSLLSTCPGIDQVVAAGSLLPPFAAHAPLLSLPGVFRTSLATIPAKVPYLWADAQLVERWRPEVSAVPPLPTPSPSGGEGKVRGSFKIGITWQGRPSHPGDRHRSVPLAQFTPLARLDGVRLVSLQVGPAAAQAAGSDLGVIDLGSRFSPASFADAAAVMMSLDLVVTVDSAVAHLAGALGVPVWVAVPFAPDFRWLLERDDSPWYPSMRLFRRKDPSNWEEVFARIAAEVRTRLT
jgi:Flp pilus assembly protein TadD